MWLTHPGPHCPSVDVLLDSMASSLGDRAVAVVLTGMGNDGAKGVQALKAARGCVLAQDEASSVIFGMPAEAIKSANVPAEQTLGIDDIYSAIEKRVISISKPSPINTCESNCMLEQGCRVNIFQIP